MNMKIKTVKRKITDIDSMKIDAQKKAVREGFDMDIIPTDLATYAGEAKKPVNLHRYMDESIPAIQKNLQKSRMCAALQEPWESCVLR